MQLFEKAKLLVGAMLAAGLISVAAPASALTAQIDVWYDRTDEPTGVNKTNEIKRAIWAWKERTGLNFVFRGQPSTATLSTEYKCVQGARQITIRYPSTTDWHGNPGWKVAAGNTSQKAAARACHTGDSYNGPDYGFVIAIAPHLSAADWGVFAHEMGHTVGLSIATQPSTPTFPNGHVTLNPGNPFAPGAQLMQPSWPYRPAITAIDTWTVTNYNRMGLTGISVNNCFAELLPDLDIAHPDVNGRFRYLDYQDVVGGLHRWKVVTSEVHTSLHPAVNPSGCSDYSVNPSTGAITLTDIRGPNSSFGTQAYSAVLNLVTPGDSTGKGAVYEAVSVTPL